jgi:TatD DNase family protein
MDARTHAKIRFFDAHTHVQFLAYEADRDAVIRRALEGGVWMMNVGTQRDTSAKAIALAEQYPEGGVYAAIGLHPVHTSKSFHDAQELGGGEAAKAFTSRGEVFDMDYYRHLAAHPAVRAIGECGLDYFHFDATEEKEVQVKKQKAAFLAQIQLSHEIKRPLMIHCRNAFSDLIQMLKDHSPLLNDSPGVIHFFTGTGEDAKQLLDLGFSFTFGGAVTFPPRKGKSAGDYDEVIKMIPIDHILSETDAPYVSPVPYRGMRNEPAYVVEIVKKLADLKSVPVEEMKGQIWENTKQVFGV